MILSCKICAKELVRHRTDKRGSICSACNVNRWKKNNIEKVSEYLHKCYEQNKERTLARIDAWQKRNPEKWNAIKKADSHNRRVKTKYNGNKIPSADLQKLVTDANGVCFYCKQEHNGNFNFDHYIPLSKGGKHELSNLRIACVSCNKHKAAKMPDDFIIVLYKSSLIDSKLRRDNEAEGVSHRERLSEKNSKEYAIVRTPTINEIGENGRNDYSYVYDIVTKMDYGNIIGTDVDMIFGAQRLDWSPESGSAVNQSSCVVVNTLV